MSDSRAIEAVTETLRGLVDAGVKRVESSAVAVARPPDRVTDSDFDMQVNLFLYQTGVEGALRNEPPMHLIPGETGTPALPLVLHYLLTPYSRDGNDIDAHRMLGGALRILHDHSVLTRAELADMAPYSDVSQQIDQIRITWRGLDEQHIYSLWSVFQSPYRVSAAFEVRVVLIDSLRAAKTPVPVLTRGSEDRGPDVQGDTTLPFPALTSAVPPRGQPAAQPGDAVTLHGGRLAGSPVTVRLVHPLIDEPLDIEPPQVSRVTDTSVRFKLPNDPARIAAGLYSVAVVHTDSQGDEHLTNSVPLIVGPRISSPMPMTVARRPNGTAVIRFDVAPHVRAEQRVLLLLGDRTFRSRAFTGTVATVEFRVRRAVPGTYLTRLRVEGVDSALIDRTTTPPQLDPTQTVTVS